MIGWISFGIKSAVRRKLRTLVTAVGVAIAVAALSSLLTFERGYQSGIRSELDRLGAHVLVAPKGCPYDAASMALHGASWPCYLKEEYLTRIRSSGGVANAAPLLMNAVYDDQSGAQSVYLGVDHELLALKRGWHIQGRYPDTGDDCLLGASVAQRLKVKLGDRFPLPGIPGSRQGTVCGVLQTTGDADDTFLFLPMRTVQEIFKRQGQLTHILVRLRDPNMLDHVVADLRGCDAGMDMNVVPLTHLFKTIQSLVNTTRVLLGCVALVALITAGAGVSNTILMAITERTGEIGMMRAVGASRSDIFRMILFETLVVCLMGGIAGVVLAAVSAPAIEAWLRSRLPFSPIGRMVHLDIPVALLCIAGASVLGAIAGLLPAFRAAQLSPVNAIRSTA